MTNVAPDTDTATDTPPDAIGPRIVFARERAGLSTAQAARRLGVKTRTLTRWERGESEPRPNRLVMLAQLLGVSPAWMLEGSANFRPTEEPTDGAEMIDIREQLKAAKRAISELSDIVDDLTQRVETTSAGARRDAA